MYFSEGFKDAKAKKRHINLHDRPFQCEVPDCIGAANGFANSKDLEKHTRSFHPEMSNLAERFNSTVQRAKSTWSCSICAKNFTRSFGLQNHLKSHRGERPHACRECGRAFTRANDRNRHEKLHERK
ncbi:hypothetical protein BDV95DRAFT_583928 [Massariosphaeria phaeospora]|uniref:C2H2-type domain-containing protein n=1 Tax=Massariosphaeria phaeospora TaxID=100035 RepID=A0A7C8M8D9_9PLEO|nr:hypothetical protein BDV95DRAFT_583928 [Massariosphaeria phaeospora]